MPTQAPRFKAAGQAERKPWQKPAFQPDKRIRGRRWQRIRESWLRDHPLCVHCLRDGVVFAGSKSNPIEVDHILNLAAGGKDDDSNYQTLCHDHNQAKMRADKAVGR